MSSDQNWSTTSVHRQTSPSFQRVCHRLFVRSVSDGSSPNSRQYGAAKRLNSYAPFSTSLSLTDAASGSAARSAR